MTRSTRREFLDGLQDSLGADRGYSVWNDLRQRQDPETPVSIKGNFPYAPLPANRSGQRGARQRLVPARPGAGRRRRRPRADEFRDHMRATC